MLPESELVMGELVVRKLSFPDGVVSRKAIVRWLALSLGLISEKESRQLALVILEQVVSLSMRAEPFTSAELIEEIVKASPESQEKAIRYHLSQLKKKGILYEKERRYYLGDPTKGSLPEQRLKALYEEELHASFQGIEKAFQKARLLKG